MGPRRRALPCQDEAWNITFRANVLGPFTALFVNGGRLW